jgi:hypothetical protein
MRLINRKPLHCVEPWKVVLAGLVIGGIFGGSIGYMLATAAPQPAPIVIQMPAR